MGRAAGADVTRRRLRWGTDLIAPSAARTDQRRDERPGRPLGLRRPGPASETRFRAAVEAAALAGDAPAPMRPARSWRGRWGSRTMSVNGGHAVVDAVDADGTAPARVRVRSLLAARAWPAAGSGGIRRRTKVIGTSRGRPPASRWPGRSWTSSSPHPGPRVDLARASCDRRPRGRQSSPADRRAHRVTDPCRGAAAVRAVPADLGRDRWRPPHAKEPRPFGERGSLSARDPDGSGHCPSRGSKSTGVPASGPSQVWVISDPPVNWAVQATSWPMSLCVG